MPAQLEVARIARPRFVWVILRKLKRILWFRKIYHVVSGLICIVLALWLSPVQTFWVATSCLTFCFLVEVWRQRDHRFHQHFMTAGAGFLRPQERFQPTGTFWTCVAMTVVTAFVHHPVLIAGCLVGWTFGDPAAEIVGRAVRSKRIRERKSLAGAAACLVVSFIAFALYFWILKQPNALVLAAIGAITTTAAESFSAPVDDNLTIPLLSALMLSFFV